MHLINRSSQMFYTRLEYLDMQKVIFKPVLACVSGKELEVKVDSLAWVWQIDGSGLSWDASGEPLIGCPNDDSERAEEILG